MMGFDSFTSKELMNINSFTPTGSWPTDDVLVEETIKAMNATEGKSDFVYTITVEGHGDYPSNRILENPTVTVTGGADEASNNQWEYYVNMLHEVDDFIGDSYPPSTDAEKIPLLYSSAIIFRLWVWLTLI